MLSRLHESPCLLHRPHRHSPTPPHLPPPASPLLRLEGLVVVVVFWALIGRSDVAFTYALNIRIQRPRRQRTVPLRCVGLLPAFQRLKKVVSPSSAESSRRALHWETRH